MIVVEGPDGAGKTTLVREIQSQFSVTIAPRIVSPQAEALTDLRQATEDRVRKLNQGVVFDRHPLISGPIYGMGMQDTRTNDFMFNDFGWLIAMMGLFYQAKPTIIYCIPPRDICLEDNRGCWPDSCHWNQRRSVYNGYVAKAATDIGLRRAVHYDYTEGTGHMQSIMGYINREEMF